MNQSVWSLRNRLKLSRSVRRTIVVVTYAVYVGLLGYWIYLPTELSGTQLATAQWLTLAGILLFLLGSLVLSASTERLDDRFQRPFYNQSSKLDERQLVLRNRAYFWSYLLFGLGIFFIWTASDRLGYFGFAIAFAGLYGSLPTAIVAWLEPDPIAEDFAPSLAKEKNHELT